MPLYQFWCDECVEPYEVTMNLATLDLFDKGKATKPCPVCGYKLRKLIAPVLFIIKE